jgi:hypothetical protein
LEFRLDTPLRTPAEKERNDDSTNDAADAWVAPATSSARAQLAFDPPELLNPFRLTDSNSFYRASPAQYTSLKALELTAKLNGVPHNASANTLRAYGLPDSDARAVQTWARNDALAELFGLLVEAIKANPARKIRERGQLAENAPPPPGDDGGVPCRAVTAEIDALISRDRAGAMRWTRAFR